MTFKTLGRRLLASGPLFRMWQRRADRTGRVLMLTYHTLGADDEDFDAWTVVRRSDFLRQVDMLRSFFDVVSINEALAGQGASSVRPRAVLTFDDGHSGWFDQLLPIVQQQALPVTLYVATSHIEDGKPYWFDRVMNAAQVRTPITVDLTPFGLGLGRMTFGSESGLKYWLLLSTLLEALKQCSDAQRDDAVAAVEQAAASAPSRNFKRLHPLTIDQLRAVAASPHVTVAGHSDDHRLLDRIPLRQARESLEQCRTKLKRWTGHDVLHIAFPNGNFNPDLSKLVAEMGFVSAATTVAGRVPPGGDVFALPRVFVGRYDDMNRFKLSLVGL